MNKLLLVIALLILNVTTIKAQTNVVDSTHYYNSNGLKYGDRLSNLLQKGLVKKDITSKNDNKLYVLTDKNYAGVEFDEATPDFSDDKKLGYISYSCNNLSEDQLKTYFDKITKFLNNKYGSSKRDTTYTKKIRFLGDYYDMRETHAEWFNGTINVSLSVSFSYATNKGQILLYILEPLNKKTFLRNLLKNKNWGKD